MTRRWKRGTEGNYAEGIRYEQTAEIKCRGNTDYLKTDARSKDGWRAIRTFHTAPTALGKKYFAVHDGLPEFVIRTPATFDVYRAGRPNAQYERWFPFELLELEMRQRKAGVADRRPRAEQKRADREFQGKNSRSARNPVG